MSEVRRRAPIAAPPEAVWVLLADIDRQPERSPGDHRIHATVGAGIGALLLRGGSGDPEPDQRVRLDRRPIHLHKEVE